MGLPSSMKHVTQIFRAKMKGVRKGQMANADTPSEESGEEACEENATQGRHPV